MVLQTPAGRKFQLHGRMLKDSLKDNHIGRSGGNSFVQFYWDDTSETPPSRTLDEYTSLVRFALMETGGDNIYVQQNVPGATMGTSYSRKSFLKTPPEGIGLLPDGTICLLVEPQALP